MDRLGLSLLLCLTLAGCAVEIIGEEDDSAGRFAAAEPLTCDESGALCWGDATPLDSETLSGWHENVRARAASEGRSWNGGYTECRPIAEQRGVIFCLSDAITTMNRILCRASVFVEGLWDSPRGTVLKDGSRGWHSIAGHDLRSQDLQRFLGAVQQRCSLDQAFCLTPAEQAFFDIVMARAETTAEGFVVVATSSDSPATATHEMLHTQFFLDRLYAAAVHEYWRALDEEERAAILRTLSDDYDETDEQLVVNEFQAYVLMQDAAWHLLGGFHDRHRQPLTEALARSGRTPFQL